MVFNKIAPPSCCFPYRWLQYSPSCLSKCPSNCSLGQVQKARNRSYSTLQNLGGVYHLNAPQTTKNKKPCKFPEVEEELGHQDLAEISGDAAKNIKPESFGFKPHIRHMDNMQLCAYNCRYASSSYIRIYMQIIKPESFGFKPNGFLLTSY